MSNIFFLLQLNPKFNFRLIFDVINSLLGIFGLSIFIIIFIVLFLIFGNIDGKPWTTVFDN